MGGILVKIILICGAKQSGKTTAATAIYGYHLTQAGAIPNAYIEESGRMFIVYDKEKRSGIYFDIDSKDEKFLEFKQTYCDPYITHVGFADKLKEVSSNLFGLNYSDLIGSNEDKNKNSNIKWKPVYNLFNGKTKKILDEIYDTNKEYMTNREWLEVFGSYICRDIKEDCHALSAYKKIKSLKSEIVINTDCRFENEFCLFENDPDVLKIKLERDEFKSPAKSERGLDKIDPSRYDLVVDNKNLSLKEKNEIIINFLISRDVLSRKNIKVD